MSILLEPFQYEYMRNAILICAAVGVVCAFISTFLMLKGWSLMGDALAHAIIPGVAVSYLLALPYAAGAFFAGIFAALSMTIVKRSTALREDAVIGIVFTFFLSIGLILASINPVAINLYAIILGNVLSISNADAIQVLIICGVALLLLLLFWKDWLLIFFDAGQARVCAIPVAALQILFFVVLSAVTVAALTTVGACLIIATIITPGATAYLLTDRFGPLIVCAVAIGFFTNAFGAYLSYFLNVPPGGLIVVFQTLLFFAAFAFAPRHGVIRNRRAQT